MRPFLPYKWDPVVNLFVAAEKLFAGSIWPASLERVENEAHGGFKKSEGTRVGVSTPVPEGVILGKEGL
jgi:hypothetical protein